MSLNEITCKKKKKNELMKRKYKESKLKTFSPLDLACQETNLSPFPSYKEEFQHKDTLKPYNCYKGTDKESSNRSSLRLIEEEFKNDRNRLKKKRLHHSAQRKKSTNGKWTPIPIISKNQIFNFKEEDLLLAKEVNKETK